MLLVVTMLDAVSVDTQFQGSELVSVRKNGIGTSLVYTCFEQMDLFVAAMWSDSLFAMALIQRYYPSITLPGDGF